MDKEFRTRRIKTKIDYQGIPFTYFLQFKVLGFWWTCATLHIDGKEDIKREVLTHWMESLDIMQCDKIYTI